MNKLYVIGFGPGDEGNMTGSCMKYLSKSDVIVGYSGYTKLLRTIFPDKSYHETGMTQETERCRYAIKLAEEGKTVSVVSSGDSGVYGMASLIFELAENVRDVVIEVIPGVTAAVSGAALLGAPLGHDFAVISLSDLLTPWEVIERRLRAAANGDFAICLYNPGSKKRAGHLSSACDILLESLPTDRLCGIARDIGRDGQSISLMTLEQLRGVKADMTETVFIGNSGTRQIRDRMITPRGYRGD
ncbi:MAG: precorrin-3B C(17)-methyltransferase [Tissierellia bacterium]|jgi:precorrin-3B C17-methyltransferase|nr:precorrin-3B C(17)-methyltransferase [Tissierellia bacterium]